MPVKVSYRVWQPKRQKTPVVVELQKAWQRKARNKFEGRKLSIKRSLMITKSSLRELNRHCKETFHSGGRKFTKEPYEEPTLGRDMWNQLKRVSIPLFNGDRRAYEGWKAGFMAWVHQAPATPEYKLLQLRQHL